MGCIHDTDSDFLNGGGQSSLQSGDVGSAILLAQHHCIVSESPWPGIHYDVRTPATLI